MRRYYLEGDIIQATAMLARRVPVLNVFYLQALARMPECTIEVEERL